MGRSTLEPDRDAPPAGMYSHGICAIALCEAYGMTDDKGLEGPAQASLDFIPILLILFAADNSICHICIQFGDLVPIDIDVGIDVGFFLFL